MLACKLVVIEKIAFAVQIGIRSMHVKFVVVVLKLNACAVCPKQVESFVFVTFIVPEHDVHDAAIVGVIHMPATNRCIHRLFHIDKQCTIVE